LYNKNDGIFIIQNGIFLDNYQFQSYWIWQIRLIVEDNCWNYIDLKNQISYIEPSTKKISDNNLGVSIAANPITWFWPLKVDFESIVNNCLNCKYEWSFGNGNTSILKNPTHTFIEWWSYNVSLVIIDSYANKAFANGVIVIKTDIQNINNMIENIIWKYKIDLWDLKKNISQGNLDEAIKNIDKIQWNNIENTQLINDLNIIKNTISQNMHFEKIDSDNDGVYDDEDKCVNIKWPVFNKWCPILEETCLVKSEKNTCKSGYICNSNWFCEIDKKINADIVGSCIYPSNGSSIFGNAVCDSCPCDFALDFRSQIRKCDILIPAIPSPDKKEIYGRGDPYQLPYDYE